MDCYTLILLVCLSVTTSAWSRPFYPALHRIRQIRVTRFAALPLRQNNYQPIHPAPRSIEPEEPKYDRLKSEEYDNEDHDTKTPGVVTGPVHTYVKTDKNANYKWGVRHHVGNKYTP